ncbi:efflux RND transporter periplasmic adaptor subunit [Bacillus sp. J14TS2]|uniref:efflux RND transporter periplasmic adaptor subunit n=1 Tax=Bacillus sp. J14TS2 TaxID=2807188 RepID=UPI001BB3BC32|nr:HlyD family efflux transporter periplasmic adaptor subunit [Bacillus sp. J14TS2]
MKKGLLFLLSVLFIGINIFLLEKDDSKVKRVTHLSDWQALASGTLEQTLQTEGMIVPAEKHPIFVDDQTAFKHFLVEKGDVVEKGTPLFEYESSHQDEQLALLDAEILRLESEKKNIDAYLEELVQMKTNLYPTTATSIHEEENKEDSQTSEAVKSASINGLSLSLDQTIAEKELDKRNIDEAIRQYEAQREAVQNGIKGLTVFSPTGGKITDLSFELKNPIMTIVSEEPIVEGRLSEKQVEEVDPDMPVKLHSSQFKQPILGEIASIEDLPFEEADLDKESFYPFSVAFEIPDEKWRIGQHLQTEIILAQANNVPIVAKNSVEKKAKQTFLWVLTEEGKTEKRMVKLGLHVDDQQEVTSGIEPGEYYVPDPTEISGANPFITSFQWDKQILRTWKKASSRKIVKYLLIGLLQK